jgi:hypothetical protein
MTFSWLIVWLLMVMVLAKEPLKNCRFAQQSFKKSGRKFQYLAIFSSKQPVFLEN